MDGWDLAGSPRQTTLAQLVRQWTRSRGSFYTFPGAEMQESQLSAQGPRPPPLTLAKWPHGQPANTATAPTTERHPTTQLHSSAPPDPDFPAVAGF